MKITFMLGVCSYIELKELYCQIYFIIFCLIALLMLN